LWKADEYHKKGLEDYHDKWQKMEWKRASEIFPNYTLFNETIDPDDINQGYIGDCYFVSSVSALAERPE